MMPDYEKNINTISVIEYYTYNLFSEAKPIKYKLQIKKIKDNSKVSMMEKYGLIINSKMYIFYIK